MPLSVLRAVAEPIHYFWGRLRLAGARLLADLHAAPQALNSMPGGDMQAVKARGDSSWR